MDCDKLIILLYFYIIIFYEVDIMSENVDLSLYSITKLLSLHASEIHWTHQSLHILQTLF